jgi:hypothetical protein
MAWVAAGKTYLATPITGTPNSACACAPRPGRPAKAEVITRAGAVFLCSHRHKMHRRAILAAGYQVGPASRRACDRTAGWPHSSDLCDESRRRLYRRAVVVWTGGEWQIRRLARHRDRLR